MLKSYSDVSDVELHLKEIQRQGLSPNLHVCHHTLVLRLPALITSTARRVTPEEHGQLSRPRECPTPAVPIFNTSKAEV